MTKIPFYQKNQILNFIHKCGTEFFVKQTVEWYLESL